jgi:hypothetical protein
MVERERHEQLLCQEVEQRKKVEEQLRCINEGLSDVLKDGPASWRNRMPTSNNSPTPPLMISKSRCVW